jgi:AraC-like DNA-binding protein
MGGAAGSSTVMALESAPMRLKVFVTDERSIAQIASLLRFCDQSYFTQVFRQRTGLTPRQYRNAHRR